MVDRDSTVSIATFYELESPGIESQWWRELSQPPRPALGPNRVFRGGRAAGRWR